MFRPLGNRTPFDPTVGVDDRLLAEQLKELSLLNVDFSLGIRCFEVGEIGLRIESLAEQWAGEDPPDPMPATCPASPVSRNEDLWLLG